MVRTPNKTCPNFSKLFGNAEPALLADFLNAQVFERLHWLETYRRDACDPDMVASAMNMLQREKKDRLSPLENEATRVITIAGTRGQFAFEGVASTKLRSDRLHVLRGQRDELARSLWAFIHETALFEAAENSLHLRL